VPCCIYMNVCTICKYIYTYAHVFHVHMKIHMYVTHIWCAHVCHTRTYAHIHILRETSNDTSPPRISSTLQHTRTHTHTHTRTHTHVHTHTHMHTTWMHAHMHAQTHTYASKCVRAQCYNMCFKVICLEYTVARQYVYIVYIHMYMKYVYIFMYMILCI